MDWTTIIVAAVSGLGAGIAGSLVAPWRNWRYEKERIKLQNRREQIKEWRDEIRAFFHDQWDYRFEDTSMYASLLPHLTEDARRAVEAAEDRYAMTLKLTLLDEVGRIEKDWDLI